MSEYEHITTDAAVETYEASNHIFAALLTEVRELSKKKPDATLSAGKVKIINRVLQDLLSFHSSEPEAKYLELLDDDALPQVSDALLIMVQFEAALGTFRGRYFQYVHGTYYWITNERLEDWEAADADLADEDEEE
jgi:hypothetical protein